MEDIVLVGGGGHCKSVIDVIIRQNKYNIAAITDINRNLGQKVCKYNITHSDENLQYLYDNGIKNAVITVGSIGDCTLRERLYYTVKKIGYNLPIIYDPSSIISEFANIDEGVFIGKNSVVNTDAIINKMAIINTCSVIEHDCNIGKFAFISVGTTLSGGVIIGDYTHVGTQTTVIQGISIGKNCMIGAGSVVVKNISDNVKAYGTPCVEVAKW